MRTSFCLASKPGLRRASVALGICRMTSWLARDDGRLLMSAQLGLPAFGLVAQEIRRSG
jgi:hypothetical protein